MTPREFRPSNDLIDTPAALRARLADEGHLFFRGLLQQFLATLQRSRKDALTAGRAPEFDALVTRLAAGDGQRGAIYVTQTEN